ncbi:MAG TPA: ATP-binding cassette domain-containing protein, partial [Savagea sp.]
GLLKPTDGTVTIGSTVIRSTTKGKMLQSLQSKVGIVFQFPEHQLFEETVEKDIIFGPMNFGVPEEVAKEKARELVTLLGLPDDTLQKSPFELSGGQMRRVAIAGVLAFEPEVLILDEPTAGLDPRGREEIMQLFETLHREKNLTTILVTHSMEDAARFADHMIVMKDGTTLAEGTPMDLFARSEEIGIDVPKSVQFQRAFEKQTGIQFSKLMLTEEALAEALVEHLQAGDANA